MLSALTKSKALTSLKATTFTFGKFLEARHTLSFNSSTTTNTLLFLTFKLANTLTNSFVLLVSKFKFSKTINSLSKTLYDKAD